MTLAITLTAAVAAVAPVDGVSIGDEGDKSTWRVHFRTDATDDQKRAANYVVASFDVAGERLAIARNAAIATIDERHAAIAARYLTPGVDYARKLREAEYVADAQSPDPDLCPMLMAGIGVSVPSSGDMIADLRAAAAIVRTRDAETAMKLAPLDHVRLAAKAAVRAATTVDQIDSVLASTTFRGL